MKKKEALALLDRSYALRACADCQPKSRAAWKTDIRCPGCGTSPKRRIQRMARGGA